MKKYQSLPSITKENAKVQLELAEGEELCLLLLSLSELDDWKWVQNIFLTYISNDDRWIASAAITGLGHLARNSRNLDKDKVINCLTHITDLDSSLEGKVQDAISDIEMFIK